MDIKYSFKGQVAWRLALPWDGRWQQHEHLPTQGPLSRWADISEEALQQVVDEIKSAGGNAIGVICDVSNESQVAAMVERTVAAFGRLDAAFNNAGIQVPSTEVADQPAEEFARVNTINLRGVWACRKHELLQMRTQGGGAIVNCSSIGGLTGRALLAAYHGSKHGVIV